MEIEKDNQAVEFLRRIVEQADEDSFDAVILEVRSWLNQVVDATEEESYPDIPTQRVPRPKLRKNRYGFYCVPVPCPGGRCKLISTGEKSLQPARRVVLESGVDRLVLLAKAGAMTAESIVIATTGRRVTCEALLKMFRDELSASMAHSTAFNYTLSAEQLFKSAGAMSKPLAWITHRKISDFINISDNKFGTRYLRLKGIRALYKFAANHGLVIGNLAATVRVDHRTMTWEKMEHKTALPFTQEEYRRFLASDRPPHFWRSAVIISYWTGLRLSDVAMLEPDAIQDDSLICFTRKRCHRLVLPFSNPLIGSPELVACLRNVKANPEMPGRCFKESFYYAPGRLWGQQQLSTDFLRLLAKIGIPNRSFHSLRHSAVSRFAAAGMTLENIGGLVGHYHTKTTLGYVHAALSSANYAAMSEEEISA